MIKLTVVAEDKGDYIGTHVDGDINGRGDLLICEMAHVLEEFYKINDGEILIKAFGMFMGKLEENDD